MRIRSQREHAPYIEVWTLINDEEPLMLLRKRNDKVQFELFVNDNGERLYCSGHCFKCFANKPHDNYIHVGVHIIPI